MGFKVNVALNGEVVETVEVDVKSEHVYEALLNVGGASTGMGVRREGAELTINLGAHPVGTVLQDDVLAEKEQEKREAVEGARRAEEKPKRKRKASPRKKVTTTARKKSPAKKKK